jgi:phage terminase large subunit-like protein
MKAAKKLELIAKATQTMVEYKRTHKLEHFRPYTWQKLTFKAGINSPQRLLMAGNRCGKTLSACFELCLHLTGIYPKWWEGQRFLNPTSCIASGITGESMRDVLQLEILGEWAADMKTFDNTGFIRNEVVGDFVRSQTTKNGLRDIRIKHVTGKWSTLSFRAYSQGHMVIAGQTRDFILIDEEPEHRSIEFYAQCIIRTMTADKGKGGRVLLSFTPEHGLTELVNGFMDNLKDGQFLKIVSWDDCPHLTKSVQDQMLLAIPPYQHKMRKYGLPVFADGMVFPIAEESISCESFKIPDWYKVLFSIDFGFTHPTSLNKIAYDPEEDIIYIVGVWKYEGMTPMEIAPQMMGKKCNQYPVIYPHDGDNTEKSTGDTMADNYRDLGINMNIKFTNEDGTNYVEPGIQEMLERMRTGRFKVFDTCVLWFEEFRRYHRKRGKIVKEFDDAIDGSRYGGLTVQRYGLTKAELSMRDNYTVDYLDI